MLQLKLLSAAAKTWCSQINKYKKKSGPRISIAIFFKDTKMFNKHVTRCSNISLYVCMLSCFSPLLTLCNPMDCSPAVSSVHGILQTGILEWVACPPRGDLTDPGIQSKSLVSPALAGGFFTTSATWEAQLTEENTVKIHLFDLLFF